MGEEWGDAASRLAALREVRLEYQVASITPCDVSSIYLIVCIGLCLTTGSTER